MNKTSIYFILFVGFLALSAPATSATQGSLQYCQKINDKARYYSSLRKAGGSAKRMEKWKQQRKKYKAKFSARKCKKWRGQLSK
jgi:hypothetical protein